MAKGVMAEIWRNVKWLCKQRGEGSGNGGVRISQLIIMAGNGWLKCSSV